ncbi:hypothetical protein CISIN_1g034301mg [Citrus sinensis]|uniref:Uncharacterized protein n=1 Tax=Citrus sinensis TaxID=2711 RepID=A0A067F318_CITSI|nr:hypothetical protein CISIN_1g034301mg [Citrus sinensis]
MQKIKNNNQISPLNYYFLTIVLHGKIREKIILPLPRAELRSFNLPIKISKTIRKESSRSSNPLIQTKGKHPPKRIQKETVQGNLHAHSSVSACLIWLI